MDIIVVDFAGTLIKKEMIEEANVIRSDILRRAVPTASEYSNPQVLYRMNRDFASNLTGIEPDFDIRYRMNDGDFIDLKGEQVLNQISTNLFQLGMYCVAKKYGTEIFAQGFLEQLQKAKEKYSLAVVSGVRTDIISGMLQIVGVDFDYIFGQPPILGADQDKDRHKLLKTGNVKFLIGDKMDDIKAASELGAESIFVKWGNPSGGEQDHADHVVDTADQLGDIL